MSRARFIAAARLELLAEVVHYAREDPHLGERFAEAVEAAVARALAFPLAGSPGLAKTRYVLVEKFPFSVFIGLSKTASSSSLLHIRHANQVLASPCAHPLTNGSRDARSSGV